MKKTDVAAGIAVLLIVGWGLNEFRLYADGMHADPEYQQEGWREYAPAKSMPPGTKCWRLADSLTCDFPTFSSTP